MLHACVGMIGIFSHFQHAHASVEHGTGHGTGFSGLNARLFRHFLRDRGRSHQANRARGILRHALEIQSLPARLVGLLELADHHQTALQPPR